MKTVLVLGSSGFIGRNLCDYLFDFDVKIIGAARTLNSKFYTTKYCDCLDFRSVENLIIDYRPDFLINCFGISNVFECEKDKLTAYKINTKLIDIILNTIDQFQVNCKFLNLGTVYEKNQENSFYSQTKKAAREIINLYRNSKNIDDNQVYLSNITGPGQSNSFVCAKIINFVKSLRDNPGAKLTLGNIESIIRPIFISDAVEQIWEATESSEKDQVIEGKFPVKIKDFVRLSFEQVGIKNWEDFVEIKQDLFRADAREFKETNDFLKTDSQNYINFIIKEMLK